MAVAAERPSKATARFERHDSQATHKDALIDDLESKF